MLSVNPCSISVVSFKEDSDPKWVRASRAPARVDKNGMPYIKRGVAGPVATTVVLALLAALAAAAATGGGS